MEDRYYAIRVWDKKTGASYNRVAGKNTPIDYRLLETMGTVMCSDGDLKEAICNKGMKDDDVGEWHLLELTAQRLNFEVYPILIDVHDTPETITPNDPNCYAQVMLKVQTDFDNFVKENCGEKITQFDFLDKI